MNPTRLGVSVTDYHTAGEPFRIVTGGIGPIPGDTILAKRRYARDHLDHVRRLVINEPRGHADMYGCFLTEPTTEGAAFGTLFFHNDGYSTACGHGTIALATWAVEHGIVDAPTDSGEVTIPIDVPSGRVEAIAEIVGGRVAAVRFRNVASFMLHEAVPIATPIGSLPVDVAFSGAFYAMVDVSDLDISVDPIDLPRLITLGRAVKTEVMRSLEVRHPDHADLDGIYGVIFYQTEADVDGRLCQRNVTVFADGQVDRSPCGSGTSARIADLTQRGTMQIGDELVHRSIIGSQFRARPLAMTTVAGRPAVLTEVIGSAHLTGVHHFVLSPHDSLGTGFVLR
jgi:proline racemase